MKKVYLLMGVCFVTGHPVVKGVYKHLDALKKELVNRVVSEFNDMLYNEDIIDMSLYYYYTVEGGIELPKKLLKLIGLSKKSSLKSFMTYCIQHKDEAIVCDILDCMDMLQNYEVVDYYV